MPAPILLIMGIIDVVAGALMLGLPQRAQVALLGLGMPRMFAFYMGFALLVKGLYSMFWGIIGSDA